MSICRDSAMSTMLTTNSPVRRMLATVSFSSPFRRGWMPSTTIGGSCEKTLKKLIGAALSWPEAERVVTSAIGRGPTKFVSSRYRPSGSSAVKSNSIWRLPM